MRRALLAALTLAAPLLPRAAAQDENGPRAVLVECGASKPYGDSPRLTLEYVEPPGLAPALLLSYQTFRPLAPGASSPVSVTSGCAVTRAVLEGGALTVANEKLACRATVAPAAGAKSFRAAFEGEPALDDCALTRADGSAADSLAQVFADVGALAPLTVR